MLLQSALDMGCDAEILAGGFQIIFFMGKYKLNPGIDRYLDGFVPRYLTDNPKASPGLKRPTHFFPVSSSGVKR